MPNYKLDLVLASEFYWWFLRFFPFLEKCYRQHLTIGSKMGKKNKNTSAQIENTIKYKNTLILQITHTKK